MKKVTIAIIGIIFCSIIFSTNIKAASIEDAYIIENNNIISYIREKTTADVFKRYVNAEGNERITKNGQSIRDDEIISTGMIFETKDNKSYTLAVKGDVSGDGEVTITDIMQAKEKVVGKNVATEAQKSAIDIDGNNEISPTDIMQLKQYQVKERDIITAKELVIENNNIVLDITQSYGSEKVRAKTIPAIANQNITFESKNTSIVEVNSRGNITGKANGTAEIIVRDTVNDFSKICNVKVETSPSKIYFDEETISIRYNEHTYQLNPKVEPNTANAKNKIKYTSSDETKATVDENGLVTKVKYGKFTITAETENGKKATVNMSSGFDIEGIPGIIANYFLEKGMPLVSIAALVGSSECESMFDPTHIEASSKCAGLFQEHPAYWDLRGFATSIGKQWTDPEAQVAYVWYCLSGEGDGRFRENNNRHIRLYDKMMDQKLSGNDDVEYTTYLFCRYYLQFMSQDQVNWPYPARNACMRYLNKAKAWYAVLLAQ